MKTAFFTNYIFTPHFETELELIQHHLDKGDTVYHFVCDSLLLSCDFNPRHEYLKCRFCIAKRTKGQKLLINTKNYFPIKISDFTLEGMLPELQLNFKSIQELRSYKLDTFEIGEAALSSLVSILRTPEPDLQSERELLANIIQSSNYIYHFLQKQLLHYQIDTFYIFNGRFAINRAALRAAQKLKIQSYIHERGNDFKMYELFENVLPHEIIPYTNRIKKLWEKHANDPAKNEIAHSFYQDRVSGKEQGWISFTKEQKKGLLPENWNPEEENIVIFNSSEDEYVSIGKDWGLGVFISQSALIQRLMNDPMLATKKLWLRLHPNMRLMEKNYLEKTYAALQGNIEIIMPESPINSYDLMHSASKVLTFGSTVGIEATYWGKVSILIGPSFYKYFDVTYNPETYEALIEQILSKDLNVFPQENTLAFGFYLNKYGIPFKFYEPRNLFQGEFKRVNLDKSFNYEKWKVAVTKKGIHWLYNKLSKINLSNQRKKYV